MRVNHQESDLENHDRGLDYDLPRLLHRRGMLKLVAGPGLAGACLITLGACADYTIIALSLYQSCVIHSGEVFSYYVF